MKLLKLHVTGLPLFKEPVDLTFYATQRVSDEGSDRLYPLFSNIYLNCAQAMIRAECFRKNIHAESDFTCIEYFE